MAPPATIPIDKFESEQFSLPFSINSRAELEVAAVVVASASAQISKLAAEQQLEAEPHKKKLEEIGAKYSPQLDALDREIKQLLDGCFAYCTKNEAMEFAESSTIKTPSAQIQFKRCPPSVRELPGWTLPKIIEAVRSWFLGARYIRIKFELNKEAILTDREKRKPFQWARRGIQIAQARSLTITPNAFPSAKASLTR